MLPSRIVRSEGFRLSVLLALLFIVSAVASAGAMYVVTKNALTNQFTASIDSAIGAVEQALRSQGEHEAVEIVEQLTAAPTNYFYLMQDKTGRKLAGNLPAMTPVFALSTLPGVDGGPDNHFVLGQGKLLTNGYYVFVGADSHELFEAREHLFTVFAGISVVTILVALAAGAALSSGMLKRNDAIIEVCRAIAANHWDRRVPDTGRGEGGILAATINGMLDRLTVLMENLRQVSTDIAHDLRTPLTHMRQRLERAQLEARTPEDYAHAMERALADSDEILAVFSALLSLAQIEAGMRAAHREAVDLSGLLAHLAEAYRPVADDQGHSLNAQIDPGITITGDRALLMQLFANLIENAIRHCPRGARITVKLNAFAGSAIASVADTGPGISATDRARVFDRFWRGEASRGMPGHGLGLSLVAAIAKLHKVHIDLRDNRPGLVAELCFPEAQQRPAEAPRAALESA